MKTVLLTGIGGFVGHHVAEYLLEKTDWNIVGVESFRHKGDSLRLVNIKHNPRVRIITHDLTTPFSDRLIDHIGPIDYILNIASESHVDRSISDPVPFCKNNVALALEVAEYARKVKPSVVLTMSTDEVFGPAHGNSHVEWDAHRPSNVYAASKAAQEDIFFAYWRSYGVPVVRTNTMNIFAIRQDPEKYIPKAIAKIHKGEPLTIHGSELRQGSRMYLEARNLADAWLFLLQNTKPTLYDPNKDATQEVDAYNIAGTELVNNFDLAKMIAEIVGKPLISEFVDFHSTRPGHDLSYSLDSSKIYSLGWRQPVPFRESLESVVKWTLRPENSVWLI